MTDLPPPPFDWTAWQARFPELAYIGETVAAGYYDQAAMMFPGVMSFYALSVPTQSMLLNLMSAHFAALYSPSATGTPSSTLVGRIASATKGSVTVAVDMPGNPTSAWYYQTKYGAQFWMATARSRLGRYRPGPVPYLGVGRDNWVWTTTGTAPPSPIFIPVPTPDGGLPNVRSGLIASGITPETALTLPAIINIFSSVTPGGIARLSGIASGTQEVINPTGIDLSLLPPPGESIDSLPADSPVLIAGSAEFSKALGDTVWHSNS